MPVVFPGAPNLRAVPGTNIYGVALPTVEGIIATLQHVGAAPGSRDAYGREVCICADLFSSGSCSDVMKLNRQSFLVDLQATIELS